MHRVMIAVCNPTPASHRHRVPDPHENRASGTRLGQPATPQAETTQCVDQHAAIDVDRARTASRTASDTSWVPCCQVGGNPCSVVTRWCRCPWGSLLQASPDPVPGARGPDRGHDPSVERTCLRRMPDTKPTGWTAYRTLEPHRKARMPHARHSGPHGGPTVDGAARTPGFWA